MEIQAYTILAIVISNLAIALTTIGITTAICFHFSNKSDRRIDELRQDTTRNLHTLLDGVEKAIKEL